MTADSAHDTSGTGDELFARVYTELHAIARRIRLGRAGETLSTTALVHEAYLKVVASDRATWENRSHFLALATRAMRQILVDTARRRLALRRGGDRWAVSLDDAALAAPVRAAELVALDEALTRLAGTEPRAARVVELRFFGGLSIQETAEALGISTPTVERDWRSARAWLATELRERVP